MNVFLIGYSSNQYLVLECLAMTYMGGKISIKIADDMKLGYHQPTSCFPILSK